MKKEEGNDICEAANFNSKPFITNDKKIIGMRFKEDFAKEIQERAETFRKNCLHYSDIYNEIEEKIEYLISKGVKEEEIKEFIDGSLKKILRKNK